MVTPGAFWDVDSVWFGEMYGGTSNNFTCYLYADNGADQPTGAPIATSNVALMPFPSPGGPITFTFTPAVRMDKGVKYWFVVHRPGDIVFFWRTASDIYAGGLVGLATDASDPTDGNWLSFGASDVGQFKVNGDEIPLYEAEVHQFNGTPAAAAAEAEAYIETLDSTTQTILDISEVGNNQFVTIFITHLEP